MILLLVNLKHLFDRSARGRVEATDLLTRVGHVGVFNDVVALKFGEDLLLRAEQQSRHDFSCLDRLQNPDDVTKTVKFAFGVSFSSEIVGLAALAERKDIRQSQAEVD